MVFGSSITGCARALTVFSLVIFATLADAQEPTTLQDPSIPVDELNWLLFPMTVEQIEVEANGWKGLLQEKVREIGDAEIASKYAEPSAEMEPEPAADSEEAEEPAEPAAPSAEVKAKYLEMLTTLREERTAIIDRFNVVLTAYAEKGGDKEPYVTYRDAVSGIQIDVSDTSAAWATVSGWAQSEEGGIRLAKNAGMFLVTVIVFWFIALIVSKVVHRVLGATRNVTTLMQKFATKGVRRVIVIIGVIVGLSQLEVDIGPLLAMIGAAGFVVAFALQDTLGNFASGIMILLYRPFDVGDFVEVAGVSGSVENLSLVSVTIKTPDNKVIIVPNNQVWGNIITNVTGSHERRIDFVFGIGYGDDMDKAQQILKEIVEGHKLILKAPEAVIRVNELADSSVNIICRPWVKTADYWGVYWDITQSVKESFDKAGISIPYPQQDVHMHQVSDS